MPSVPQAPVSIRPIGVVVADYKDFSQRTTFDSVKEIFIREDLEPGLTGLEHFSHIHVTYHEHRCKEWQKAAGWPDGPQQVLTMPLSGEPSCKGIFTSRAPARPSALGSTVCELVRKEGNRLFVKGLDVFDGTAILDIKIYLARYDSFPNASAPLHWCSTHGVDVTSRALHWDTMNVALSLGLRTALRALKELGIGRGEATYAEVVGGNFFAQGIEGVTGCSVLRQTMAFKEQIRPMSDWHLRLCADDQAVDILLRDHLYQGADEVLTLPEERLFRDVRTSSLDG